MTINACAPTGSEDRGSGEVLGSQADDTYGSGYGEIIGHRTTIEDLISSSKGLEEFGKPKYQIEPITKNEEVAGFGIPLLKYKLDSEYNYYTDYFEKIVKTQDGILEAALPNLYIIGDKLKKSTPQYDRYVTVSGNLGITPENENTNYEYYDAYGKFYKTSILSENKDIFDQFASEQTKIFFTKNQINSFKEINENINLIPYANKIEFDTNNLAVFAAILDNSKFLEIFCGKIAQTNLNIGQLLLETKTVYNDKGSLKVSSSMSEENVPGLFFEDIPTFISLLKNYIFSLSDLDRMLVLGNQELNEYIANITSANSNNSGMSMAEINNRKSTLYYAIYLSIFLEKFGNFIKAYSLTPKQFLHGAFNYSELFFYELDKQQNENETVQKFYIPNSTEYTKIEFFDSQVKFGKDYFYNLNGFFFGLAQKFDTTQLENLSSLQLNDIIAYGTSKDISFRDYYNNLRDLNEQQYKIFWEIFIEGMSKIGLKPFKYSLNLFKKNIFREKLAVFDHPPSPPEVRVDGMMGIDDKLFFILNGSISELKQRPVLIQSEDADIFAKNITNQKLNGLEDIMTFDGDDGIEYFQIFRLDYHPTNYREFKNNFKTIATRIQCAEQTSTLQACEWIERNHATFLDTVKANKKYYYIFRSVDVHGNISNPSPIYEIEMVNSEGTIFPIINTVDLLPTNNKSSSKTAKRFLHIRPNAMQMFINEQQSQYYILNENGEQDLKNSANEVKNSVVLGLAEEKIWNKKFRLKVRSKLTGKIIEVDFKFIYKMLDSDTVC